MHVNPCSPAWTKVIVVLVGARQEDRLGTPPFGEAHWLIRSTVPPKLSSTTRDHRCIKYKVG